MSDCPDCCCCLLHFCPVFRGRFALPAISDMETARTSSSLSFCLTCFALTKTRPVTCHARDRRPPIAPAPGLLFDLADCHLFRVLTAHFFSYSFPPSPCNLQLFLFQHCSSVLGKTPRIAIEISRPQTLKSTKLRTGCGYLVSSLLFQLRYLHNIQFGGSLENFHVPDQTRPHQAWKVPNGCPHTRTKKDCNPPLAAAHQPST